MEKYTNNDPACSTDSLSATINNHVINAEQVRYANIPIDIYCSNADLSSVTYEPASTNRSWQLDQGIGEKKVCAEFKNLSGSVKCGGTIRYVVISPPSPPPFAGFDEDSDIDFIDYHLLLPHFNQTFDQYNLVGTNLIDIFDLNRLITYF